MDIQKKMIQYRARHNVSQAELAIRCGVCRKTIWGIENGDQKPKAKVLGKILKIIEEE